MSNQKAFFIIILSGLFLFGLFYLSQTKPIANYPSKGTDIIAFGDSLIEGVGSTPGNDFISLLSKNINKPIINLGHSGDTTQNGVVRIGQLDRYNPKLVILLLGGNDYLKNIPISETFKNLAFIIENIQARGAMVLLLGIQGGIITDNFNNKFEDLRDTYHTAYVSNVLDGLFANMRYMSDPVHPNDKGYKIIADRVYPVLERILK